MIGFTRQQFGESQLLLPRQLVAADCRGFLSPSLLYRHLIGCQAPILDLTKVFLSVQFRYG